MTNTIAMNAAGRAGRNKGDRRFLENGPLFPVSRLLWILAAMATFAIPSPDDGVTLMVAVSLCWMVFTVQRRGGPYLTPSGVYFLSSGVFIGVAGFYLLGREATAASMEGIHGAAVLAFSLTVLTELVASSFCIKWQVAWERPRTDEIGRTDYRPPNQFVLRGLVLLVASRLPPLIAINYEFTTALGLAGMAVIALTALSFLRRIRWLGDVVIVGVGLLIPVIWVGTVFKGGGRLTVAGLGVSLVVAISLIRPSGWQKILLLASLPVFLLGAGYNRLDKIEREYGVVAEATSSDVLSSGEGLESVYDPLDKFAYVLSEPDYPSGGSIGPRYGATFLNSLLMPIPRSMWEGKPKGFGAELTELITPELVRINQSWAALFYTEWYANFGYVGLLLAPLAVGWFLARLDKTHCRLAASRLGAPQDWWGAVVLMCLVTSLGDLYWSGTFTYLTRGGMAAIIAWGVGKLSIKNVRPLGGRALLDEQAHSRSVDPPYVVDR